ncbi:MAG: hypothetical protein IKO72_14265 [Kiritimatiellae bacterium]|nr:hypothetical protein [Kiritimatiellia bacterium]
MLESIIAMFFLCLVFFLVVDYAELLRTRTILDYAAARGARARAVGFNDFMVTKTVRIASMAAAGECRTARESSISPTVGFLSSRAGSYLEAEYESDTKGILDFALWDPSVFGWHADESHGGSQADIAFEVHQLHPLVSGLPGSPEAATMRGSAKIESHYPYYLK